MRWLNYHHLLYFWTVARTGSIAAASKELFLSQPAISTQLKGFETSIGTRLFVRDGNRLQLTETGQLAFDYADRIFRLGGELRAMLELRDDTRRLRVGLGQMYPKMISGSLLAAAWSPAARYSLECREASADVLLRALDDRALDVVVLDEDPDTPVTNRFRQHVLVEAEIGFFGPQSLAHLRKDFPNSLHSTAVIAPPVSSKNWVRLDQWLKSRGCHVRPAAECDDSALGVSLARSMNAVFPAPVSASDELARSQGLCLIGTAEGLNCAVTAYSNERTTSHPGVDALIGAFPGLPLEQIA